MRWQKRIKRGEVWLIRGNHDPSVKQCRDVFGDRYREVFETKIRDKPTWLSHYPHAYWPKSHHGGFHLYGHTHANREVTLDVVFPDRRSMDVGVDNAHELLGEFRPFTEDEVFEILSSRLGHDPVEWYRKYHETREPAC